MKFIWIDVRGAFGLLLPMVSTIFSDNELATPAVTGDVTFGPLQLKINNFFYKISVMEYKRVFLFVLSLVNILSQTPSSKKKKIRFRMSLFRGN